MKQQYVILKSNSIAYEFLRKIDNVSIELRNTNTNKKGIISIETAKTMFKNNPQLNQMIQKYPNVASLLSFMAVETN